MTGEEFAKLRKELGLTQEELGSKVGLSRVTIGKIERAATVSAVHSNLIGYARLVKAVREYNRSADMMVSVANGETNELLK
jgi:transcriptional regulator with XRE-family HTH domain